MKAQDVETVLKALLLKDLRIQCRARQLSPAGGKEALIEKLRDEMLKSGDYTLKTVEGAVDKTLTENIMGRAAMRETHLVNNYHRPEGQNVGNFITDRTSSRVLAPPGGGCQVSLSMDTPPVPVPEKVKVEVPARHVATLPMPAPQPVAHAACAEHAPATHEAPALAENTATVASIGISEIGKEANNNYSRPGGMQNVGNFITDRNTSRVIAPPGGTSSVSLG